MPPLRMLPVSCLLLQLLLAVTPQSAPQQELLALNETRSFTVSSARLLEIEVNFTQAANDSTALRFETRGYSNETLLLVARQQDILHTWSLPYAFVESNDVGKDETQTSFQTVGRTLCPPQLHPKTQQHQQVFLHVTTKSLALVSFNATARIVEDFRLPLNVSVPAQLLPSSPSLFLFDFQDFNDMHLEAVRVVVESEDAACGMVSVQNSRCPAQQLPPSVQHTGYRQTVKSSAVILMRRDEFSSFLVVLLAFPSNSRCLPSWQQQDRRVFHSKNVTIRVEKINMHEDVGGAVAYLVLIFSGFNLLIVISTFAIICMGKGREGRSNCCDKKTNCRISLCGSAACRKNCSCRCYCVTCQCFSSSSADGCFRCDYESYEAKDSAVQQQSNATQVEGHKVSQDQTVATGDGQNDEIDVQHATQVESHKVSQDQTVATGDGQNDEIDVQHATQVESHKVSNSLLLLAIMIFYGLPVVQLMFQLQQNLNAGGDMDKCYYNFKCRFYVKTPLVTFYAFNNFISNVGYVSAGLVFIVTVGFKEYCFDKWFLKGQPASIPRCYSAHYAAGLALLMEGVLSGFYHICPTHDTFQFDTAFMIIMSGMIGLALYNKRHPSENSLTHVVYVAGAVTVLINSVGILLSNLSNSATFIALGVVLLLASLGYVIYRLHHCSLSTDRSLSAAGLCRTAGRIIRIISVAVNTGLGILFIGLGANHSRRSFADCVLLLVIANTSIYFLYYSACKFMKCSLCYETTPHRRRNRESNLYFRVGIAAILLLAAFLILFSIAGNYFLDPPTDWNASPAQSRSSNKDCMVRWLFGLPFDQHDLWHLLGSLGLFCLLLFILCMDMDEEGSELENEDIF